MRLHWRAKWPPVVVARAREMHEQGKGVGWIAHRLGVPYHTVRDWIKGWTRVTI